MKKTLYTILIFTIFLNCNDSSNEDIFLNDKIYEYNPFYMDYRNTEPGYFLSDMIGGTENVKIEYTNDKISKRINKLFYTNYFNYIKYNTYDEITYEGNIINIATKSSENLKIHEKNKTIILNQDLISEVILKNNYYNNDGDTLKFKYSNKNIESITVYSKGIKSKSKFYYNKNKNLDSIITKYGVPHRNGVNNNYTYIYHENTKARQKEIFKDYDNYKNPLKSLIIFDETFKRALSNNNFKTYEKFFINENNDVLDYYKENWSFTYENNKINFAK